MDKEYQNDRFVTLRIKEPVAQEFRKFCKQQSKSQSIALEGMLEFFKRNAILPEDEVTTDLKKLESKLLKRINAIISIIRDIEKTQTLPTLVIVKSFLEGFDEQEEAPLFVEKNQKRLSLEEELIQMKKLRDG